MMINKYISWSVYRNHDLSCGLGVEVYIHKHIKACPYHFHILITFLLWYWELQLGDDAPKEEE